MKKISTLLFALLFLFFNSQAQLVVFGDEFAPGLNYVPFGGSIGAPVIDGSEFRSGTKSLKIAVPTGGYIGGTYIASTPQDLSSYNAVTFWAKNDATGNMLNGAGYGNDGAGGAAFPVETNALVVTNTWKKFIIPLPKPSVMNAATALFHFAESEAAIYNVWIDDIQYETVGAGVIGTHTAEIVNETQTKAVGETFTPVGAFSIYKINGVDQRMQTGAAHFDWISSNTAVASINSMGEVLAKTGGSSNITAKLGTVNAAGLLTFNVIAPLPVPMVAAPVPNRAAYSVKSLFSDVYDNSNVSSWATDWSGCCRDYTPMTIAGNDTKKYVLRHFTGVQFDNINASNLDTLHLDVWTPTPSVPLTVRLVNFAGTTSEGEITTTIAGEQWVSLNLPLNQMKFQGNGAVMGKTNLQQMLLLVQPGSTGTFYFDNIYFYRSGASLPVTLSDFNVTKRGNTSVLNWKTLTEENSKGFYVERSSNGSEFTQLQFVNASNRLTSVKQYSIVDQTPLNGTNYYRLKQVDNDGKVSYSNIVSLKFSAFGSSVFSFYPNPAKTKITVLLQTITSRSASVQLANAEGRMVRNVIINSQSSGSNINIDIANLAKGLYFLTLKDGPVVQTTKVIVN